MGFPAAGKSTLVQKYEKQGYARFNRDDMGGSLKGLAKRVEEALEKTVTDVVLDNTYGTKENRRVVIDLAEKFGMKSKCVWLDTSIEDAQFNSSSRIMMTVFGMGRTFVEEIMGKVIPHKMLGPDSKKIIDSPDNIPAIALFAYKKAFEKPDVKEGFDGVEIAKFKRNFPTVYTEKAILLDYDGTLRVTKSGEKYPCDPDDVEVLPNRKEVLQRWKDMGYLLLGVSNQSGIEKGKLDERAAIACFDRTNELVGHDIEYQYCPHHSFPIRCYCRKPMPGLGVYFVHKHLLNPEECIMVGDATSDKTFAKRCGFKFEKADDFFEIKLK